MSTESKMRNTGLDSAPVPATEPPPPGDRKRRGASHAVRWIAGMAAVAVVGGVVFVSTRGNDQSQPAGGRAAISIASLTQTTQAPPHSPAATMIANVLPSVVNIRVVQSGSTSSGAGEIKAEGSGVILTSNGLILTNNHVVQHAVRVRVLFTSGHTALSGTVVGTDPQRDLAVIKVDATGLKPLPLGRSSDLKLADTVYAIGFPLDLGITVTSGIVSGLDRSIAVNGESTVEHLAGLVQTDAAINPGNSGGALVDMSGRLVGINTAGVSATSADNVGFAIRIDEALQVVKRILAEPR